jgi:hypothetical protein
VTCDIDVTGNNGDEVTDGTGAAGGAVGTIAIDVNVRLERPGVGAGGRNRSANGVDNTAAATPARLAFRVDNNGDGAITYQIMLAQVSNDKRKS